MVTVKIALERTGVQIVRGIVNELRKSNSKNKLQENDLVKYLITESRHNQTTDEQACHAQNEQLFLAESYLVYLESARKYQEINALYSGKGERSVKETAGLVGFKLPHDPK